jgi:hypothetical protein
LIRANTYLRTHVLLGASIAVLLTACGGGGSTGEGVQASAGVDAYVSADAAAADLEAKRRRNTSTPVPAPETTVPSTSRDVLKQPFAVNSIWNMPIGSNAQYVAANLLPSPRNAQWATVFDPEPERIVMTPNAPLTTFNYSSAAWSGADRCSPTGGGGIGVPVSVPMPADYIVPNSNHNEGAAFLAADGRTVIQMQPIARCTAGGPGTTLIAAPEWKVDIYGDGIKGAHGGSGLSVLGGTIRVGEMRPGQQGAKHALKINVDGPSELYHATTRTESYIWPAVTSDSYWSNYGTDAAVNSTNTAMKLGALLAIPATTSIGSLGLETEPGKQMAWTLQNYGTYIVDTYLGPDTGYAVEEGTAGSFSEQFNRDYGFKLQARYGDNTPWSRDLAKIRVALKVVKNNSVSSIGGGGTPLQPLAPALN